MNKLFFWAFMALFGKISAQTVPVGFPFFDEALRREQLMGNADSNLSFMIRPVHPRLGLGIKKTFEYDSARFPSDSFQYKKKYNLSDAKAGYVLRVLPVLFKTRYNQHHPYGWNDGSMVPSKGLQWQLSGGFYGRYKFIEAQLRPEYVQAQNLPFQNPPERARSIDNPERMGQDPYKRNFSGQSYIKVHLGPLSVGYSSENLSWAGGYYNNIILSNNAPGFGHYSLQTNRPIKTKYGSVEGHIIAGQLKHSGFKYPINQDWGTWPPQAGDVITDPTAPEYHSYFTGMNFVFQPKWLPGLFLGAMRISQVSGEPQSERDYITASILGREIGQGGTSISLNRNQVVGVSARYLLKEAHAELYAEIGREDWWGDVEDLITRPFYSTVWMMGFKKLQWVANDKSWLEFLFEGTHIKGSLDNFIQPDIAGYHSFYMHGNGVGWTNQGQVMGAGIGPGSNMFTLGVSKIKEMRQTGIFFEHVLHNDDLFHGRMPFLSYGGTNPLWKDYSKRWVDWGFKLHHHQPYFKRNLTVGYTLHLMRTYNFNWVYDPDGVAGTFRFPGINVWSINTEISAVYFF